MLGLRKRTRKLQKAGDIEHPIFNNILSIGYEFESSSIAKLTLIEDNDNKILLNTDVTLKVLKNLGLLGGTSKTKTKSDQEEEDENEEDENEEDEDDDNDDDANEEEDLRKQELINFDIYTTETIYSKTKKNLENATFEVLNDMSKTSFSKYSKA